MFFTNQERCGTIYLSCSADIGNIVKECPKQHIIQRMMRAEIDEERQAYGHKTRDIEQNAIQQILPPLVRQQDKPCPEHHSTSAESICQARQETEGKDASQ